MPARGAVMRKTARNAVKLRHGKFREQCFDNCGEKIDVCLNSVYSVNNFCRVCNVNFDI